MTRFEATRKVHDFSKESIYQSHLRSNINRLKETPTILNRVKSETPCTNTDNFRSYKREGKFFYSTLIKESNPIPKLTPSYSVKKFEFPRIPKKYRQKAKRSARNDIFGAGKKLNRMGNFKEKRSVSPNLYTNRISFSKIL